MAKLTSEQQRLNLTTNMTYLASHFKSYGVLSRILGCSSKFTSRAISNPHELSLSVTVCASKTLGIENKVLLGGHTAFKKGVSGWIKKQLEIIEDKKRIKVENKRGFKKRDTKAVGNF